MYQYELRKSVEKIFFKLAKKNPRELDAIFKKINEIVMNPHHFKNLRKPLQHLKRVHIGHFVLVYSVNEELKTVIIEDYEHHNLIYR